MVSHPSCPGALWISARLELARTPRFVRGSPARAYILHLPVDADGRIDEPELRAHPARALVRRFWPNQPDLVGTLVPVPGGWAFSYRDGLDDDEALYRLSNHRIVAGDMVTIDGPGGERLPFRIAETRPL